MVIVSIILGFIFGLSKAVKDTLDHHYESSIFVKYNRLFFDPKVSWLNKYKDYSKGTEAKFPGSKTIFVFLTDAWHLFDAIQAISWQICLTMWITVALDLDCPYGIGVFAAIKIVCDCAFHFPYTYWFIKK